MPSSNWSVVGRSHTPSRLATGAVERSTPTAEKSTLLTPAAFFTQGLPGASNSAAVVAPGQFTASARA